MGRRAHFEGFAESSRVRAPGRKQVIALDDRLGFPDLGGRSRDVWFTPMSGHRQRDR
jgi:hypothetical protein